MQDEVFSLNLVVKYARSTPIYIWSTDPDPPNWIALNWTMQSQPRPASPNCQGELSSSDTLCSIEW